jgi:hypothetical protein
VQPSGLVFLVIIAIWAAYLLQHWVRRREHLATARSVDRFSEAMHVLERRTTLPQLDLPAPRPRSYAVSPARPSRPEVVVKRAHSLTPNISTPAAAVRPTRFFHALAGVSARRGRGLSLLTSLLLTVGVSSLAAVSVLRWWVVLVAVAVLLVDVAWLRHVAVTQRALRQANALARGSAASPPPAFGSVTEQMVAPPGAGGDEVAESGGYPAEVDQAGWAPVPVPPPTYTLKARAGPSVSDPETEPVPTSEPTPSLAPSLDDLVDEGELDGLLDRRRSAAT